MSFMNELRINRQKFLDGLEANQGDINLDIFEDFYPDKAHFVFELLQNAEDTGATECKFTLADDQLLFRHNGIRQFSEPDIRSITGIHNSTKTKSTEAIGKFGVGFKSVFIYTLTPEIHSGDYSFLIRNLVMPELIDPVVGLGQDTVFRFPFNNQLKKTQEEVYSEILEGLERLSELTLLFLKGIEIVKWEIESGGESKLFRVPLSERHIQVVKEVNGTKVSNGHFLRFSQPAGGHETQHICIAFPLQQRSEESLLGENRPLGERFRITPAQPGRVSVFFPAEKETSGLRFHIHGPFIPTLDRSSVKDTAANAPLFSQIAKFSAEILSEIHELGLLTNEFLGVLPNPADNLELRYQPIRVAIVREMNSKSLTPKNLGGHAPARQLLQGKAILKDLLGIEDLKLMLPSNAEGYLWQWAIAANQKNTNVDKFLGSLEIREWGADQFLDWLRGNFSADNCRLPIMGAGLLDEWLKGKPCDWLQKFYAFLYREFSPRDLLYKLKKLRLVRLADESLSVGEGCFFVEENNSRGDYAKWVPRELWNSGESLNDKKDAYLFLEAMGIRKLGDREQMELLLKRRYQNKDFAPELDDMKTFLAHWKSYPGDLDIFEGVPIFKREDGKWSSGKKIFIDDPFSDTGLAEIYQNSPNTSRFLLSSQYLDTGLPKKEFLKFAESLGAISNLYISSGNCQMNPEWEYLRSAPGKITTSPVDEDFFISRFEEIFHNCPLRLSLLIWDTLTETSDISKYLVATYRKNMRGGSRTAPSRLVYQLRNTAWVPQRGFGPVRPPCADLALLPDGFAYDERSKWIEALHFGAELESRKEAKAHEDDVLRKTLGIDPSQPLEEIREFLKAFAQLPPDRRRKHMDEFQQELNFELPEEELKNTDLRRDRVREDAKNAPEHETEKRQRSVSVGLEPVKEQASQYLVQQYSNGDQVMICQICQKELPFKLADGTYYFEAVLFLPGFKQMHHQNYLALCPNHAAMFKHANASKDQLKQLFLGIGTDRKMTLELADTEHSVYFNHKHRLDLTMLVEADPATATDSAST